MTTRGLETKDCKELAYLIHRAIILGRMVETKKLSEFKEQIDDYLTDKYTMDDIEEIKSITLQQLQKDVVTFSKQFRYDFRL